MDDRAVLDGLSVIDHYVSDLERLVGLEGGKPGEYPVDDCRIEGPSSPSLSYVVRGLKQSLLALKRSLGVEPDAAAYFQELRQRLEEKRPKT